MCLITSQSRVESRLESRVDRQDFYRGMSGLSVSGAGGMKNHLGEKVKVNSRSVYGARGRVNIGFFLTDPTPSEKRLSV